MEDFKLKWKNVAINMILVGSDTRLSRFQLLCKFLSINQIFKLL